MKPRGVGCVVCLIIVPNEERRDGSSKKPTKTISPTPCHVYCTRNGHVSWEGSIDWGDGPQKNEVSTRNLIRQSQPSPFLKKKIALHDGKPEFGSDIHMPPIFAPLQMSGRNLDFCSSDPLKFKLFTSNILWAKYAKQNPGSDFDN